MDSNVTDQARLGVRAQTRPSPRGYKIEGSETVKVKSKDEMVSLLILVEWRVSCFAVPIASVSLSSPAEVVESLPAWRGILSSQLGETETRNGKRVALSHHRQSERDIEQPRSLLVEYWWLGALGVRISVMHVDPYYNFPAFSRPAGLKYNLI